MSKCDYKFVDHKRKQEYSCDLDRNLEEDLFFHTGTFCYCLFHAPADLGNERLPAKTAWALPERYLFNEKLKETISRRSKKRALVLIGVVFPGEALLRDIEATSLRMYGISVVQNEIPKLVIAIDRCRISGSIQLYFVKGVIDIFIGNTCAEEECKRNRPIQFEHCEIDHIDIYPTYSSVSIVNSRVISIFAPDCDIPELYIRNSTIGDMNSIGGNANFRGSNIKTLFISNCTFYGEMRADSSAETAQRMSTCRISKSRFHKQLNLNNKVFGDSTEIEYCTFFAAPKFHNSKLHQETSFAGSAFEDVAFESNHDYRTLRQAMEANRAFREQGYFYVREQRCLRNAPNASLTKKLISYLYDITSEYGQDYVRPLLVLLALTPHFFFLYLLLFKAAETGINPLTTLDFTLSQIFRPFNSWWNTDAIPATSPGILLALKVVSSLHSLINVALISLVALGLRWHFKNN